MSTVYAFIIHYTKQHYFLFFAVLFHAVVQASQSSLSPLLIGLIIDTIVDNTNDSPGPKLDIIQACLFLFGAYVFFGYSYVVRDITFRQVMPNIQKDIWLDLFSNLKHHSHNYFQKNFSGNLSEKVSLLVSGYRSSIELSELFMTRILGLLLACTLLLLSHPFYFIAISVWSLLFFIVSFWLTKRSRLLSKDLSSYKNIVSGKLVDTIANILAIKVFSRIQYESNYIDSHLNEIVQKDKDLQLFSLQTRIIQTTMVIVLIAVMLALLVLLHGRGLVTPGDFVFIIGVTLGVSAMVNGLGVALVKFSELNGALSQALETINSSHEQKEVKNAQKLNVTGGAIQFKDVSFTYDNHHADKQISLNTINIKANEKIGVVGYSGSGKTTFINLILRLYDLNTGSIFIDQQDISQVTRDSIYQNISLIPQEITLFNRSIMENIRYAKLTASDQEIIEACKMAHIDEFITSLDKQYDTEIGGKGINVSTGQKQRIAIARAFLKNAPILILDEPTSALDAITEEKIQLSLQMLMQNKTVIIIAHRLTTLSKMDRIFVFDKGRVDGHAASHEELLTSNALYSKLWKAQSQGYLPNV